MVLRAAAKDENVPRPCTLMTLQELVVKSFQITESFHTNSWHWRRVEDAVSAYPDHSVILRSQLLAALTGKVKGSTQVAGRVGVGTAPIGDVGVLQGTR